MAARNGTADDDARYERTAGPTDGEVSPEEWFVLSRLEGVDTLPGLTRSCGLPLERVRKVAAGLVEKGLLRRVAAAVPPPGLEPSLARTLRELDGRLGALDHYAVLGVPCDASPETIREAWVAGTRRFHPDRHFGVDLGEDAARLARVVQRLRTAYDVLSDEAARADYDRSLSGSAPGGALGARRENDTRRRQLLGRLGGRYRLQKSRELAQEAAVAEAAGNPHEATRLWSLAAALDVNNPAYAAKATSLADQGAEVEARQLQAAAALAEASGRLHEAEQQLCAAAKASPRCAHCQVTLARFLLRLGGEGGVQRALVAARHATRLQPQDPETWRVLGSALTEAGQPEDARWAQERAGQVDGNRHTGRSR